MKKQCLSLLLCVLMVSGALAGTKFTITSKLDDKNMPVDDLASIPFVQDRQYLMFLIQDDYSAFGVEKIYFEINVYDEESGKYKYSDLYTVDTKTDWGYCYKGVIFNMPMKLKIRAFTNNGELATKYIEVVKQD